jgi:hypothetical protein
VSPVGTDLAGALEDLAGRLESSQGDALLLADDLVLHPDALADLAEDPRRTTAALVSRAGPGSDLRPGGEATVRLRGGRVLAASSTVHRVHRGDAAFTGALRVADGDRPAAAEAARRAASLAAGSGWSGDALDYLLVALVRSGTAVGAVTLDPWPWRRGGEDADREAFADGLAAIGPQESHRLRLARATKADDGTVATALSRPLSRLLTPLALRRGLTPDQVTLASFVVGLGAAACFATGDGVALVVGAVLLQVSLVVDCVDGDVARYTRSFSARGAWLDASTDRLKEFACYGGLAWGSGAGAPAWLLAAAMLTLQTARHTVDYTFTAVKDLREAEDAAAPLERVDDAVSTGDSTAGRAVLASERSNRVPLVKWVKRTVHLSIGERWLVLSVLAAAGRPRLALVVLLVLGLLSLAYTSAGRTLRARSWRVVEPSPRERQVVAAQVDPGLLPRSTVDMAAASRPGGGRFLWVRPALLRVVEYAVVAGVVLAAGGGESAAAAAYVLLLVVASHHYDALYRVLNGLTPTSRATQALGLGLLGRPVLVALLAVAGGTVLAGGLWAAAAVLGILYLVVEPVGVLRAVRAAPPGDSDVLGDGDG